MQPFHPRVFVSFALRLKFSDQTAKVFDPFYLLGVIFYAGFRGRAGDSDNRDPPDTLSEVAR